MVNLVAVLNGRLLTQHGCDRPHTLLLSLWHTRSHTNPTYLRTHPTEHGRDRTGVVVAVCLLAAGATEGQVTAGKFESEKFINTVWH